MYSAVQAKFPVGCLLLVAVRRVLNKDQLGRISEICHTPNGRVYCRGDNDFEVEMDGTSLQSVSIAFAVKQGKTSVV